MGRVINAAGRLIAAPTRLARRLALATRYYLALNYTWHLAWMKAER